MNSGYLSWEPPGKAISIQLHTEAMERIEREVMEGVQALRRRGAEVGGLLLGRTESNGQRKIIIQDVAPLRCEHLYGPSFILSENDRLKLEETLALVKSGPDKNVSVVGYYRSHTRPDLFLDDNDFSLISTYFADPLCVFLLIRPVATQDSTAGFFFWEGDQLRRGSSYQEFPFGRGHASGQEPVEWQQRQQQQPQPTLASSADPLPESRGSQSAAGPRPRRSRRLLWLPIMTLAAIAAFLVYDRLRTSPGPQREEAAGRGPARLGLSIESTGEKVRVIWDPGASGILNSRRVVLSITDGDRKKDVPLDEKQLRTGSLVYLPATDDVNFELQVANAQDVSSSESIRMVKAGSLSGTPTGPEKEAGPSAIPEEPVPAPGRALLPPFEKRELPPSAPEAAKTGGTALESEIRAFLSRWVGALKRGDRETYIACYAPSLDVYFTKRNVNRAEVRQNVQRMLATYGPLRTYGIRELKVQPGGPNRAIATFRKQWETAGPRVFSGDELERLVLSKVRGKWQISSEEELKVYRLRRDK